MLSGIRLKLPTIYIVGNFGGVLTWQLGGSQESAKLKTTPIFLAADTCTWYVACAARLAPL